VSRITALESPLLTGKAAALAAGAKALRERWIVEWTLSSRYLRLSLFDSPSPPSHFLLNSYLYHFHLGPTPDCALCLVPETVPHFLLSCPAYRRQRLRLIQRLGTARLSLRLLLVKSQPKPVLDFLRETERFPRYAL
jgi:hypothetical protein